MSCLEIRISFETIRSELFVHADDPANGIRASVPLWEGDGEGTDGELKKRLDDIQAGYDLLKTAPLSDLKLWGTTLFKTAFRGDTLSLFDSLTPSVGPDRPLRIRFVHNHLSENFFWLSQLPWELIFWQRGQIFLVQDRRFSIVRTLQVPWNRAMTSTQQAQCLFALASPTGSGALQVDRESLSLPKVSNASRLQKVTVRSATRKRLRTALLDETVHVFHFGGHGYRERNGSELSFGVILEDAFGDPDRMGSDELGRWIADAGVQLVVLNGCWTGAKSRRNSSSFHGVAQRLIRAGIPAVLAMAHPVKDSSAIELAQTFYERLARTDSIESALTEARRHIHELHSNFHEWLTPVLFLQSPQSELLARPSNSPTNRQSEADSRSEVEVRVKDSKLERSKIVGEDSELPSHADANQPNVRVHVEAVEGRGIEIVGKRTRPFQPKS